jgi:hypothetical protein
MTAAKAGRFIKYNDAIIAHCTIVGNSKEGILEGKATVVNSIIYSNGAGGSASQINARDAVVSYCDVEGGYPGTGNISEDPGFGWPGFWTSPHGSNDKAMVWMGGDYHLGENSPCINAGDPAFALEPFSFDMDGQPRVIGGRADIGCDEAND